MALGDCRRATARVGDLTLESGEVLPDVRMSYRSWGRPDPRGDNVVLVLHALTGDSLVSGDVGPGQPTPGWWPGLIGAPGTDEGALDTDRWCVIAPDILGGCRGSTGPSSPGPDGEPWGSSFPRLTVRDQVAAERALLDSLEIGSLAAVIGGSMGGMRALEWAVTHPTDVRRCIVLASTAAASADQIAWATPQLAAIRQDPAFQGGDYYPGKGPRSGLAIARQIAHATYRSDAELDTRFGREPQPGEDPLQRGRFAVQSYLQHHGEKLVRRFDANSYLVLTEAMNTHDVGRGRGGVERALARVSAEVSVASVSSDRLYRVHEGERIATAVPRLRTHRVIESPHGHDGFLIETGQVFTVIEDALREAPTLLHPRARTPRASTAQEEGIERRVGVVG